MRLRSLLVVSLLHILSTSCGAGADNDDLSESIEGTSKNTADPLKQISTPDKLIEGSKTCMLTGISLCPVLHPDSWTKCSDELRAFTKGELTKCEYDTCYIERVSVESAVYHAACVNVACPAFAVDIDLFRRCATELRDENLECMRSTNCSVHECPMLQGYTEQQRFMRDCLSD